MSDMPDKIWASSQRLNNVWGTKEYSETTEYTRTDLAQATIEKVTLMYEAKYEVMFMEAHEQAATIEKLEGLFTEMVNAPEKHAGAVWMEKLAQLKGDR